MPPIASPIVNLDLSKLSPDQQVDRLKKQYRLLRGKGAVVRAAVRELPARQYISILERGYRVALEREGEAFVLVLSPDGSTPRLGLRGAHSVVSHSDGRVYTNTTGNRIAVSVIRTSDHEVVATIAAGAGAHLPVLSPDGRVGYVANLAADKLTVWRCADHRVVATVPVGIYPHFFAISPDGNRLIVSNTGESSVCLIDAHEHQAEARVQVGAAPAHLAFSPDGELAFVGCESTDQVAVIDLRRKQVFELIKAGALS